jgi:5-methylcytosine-specific restriction endonuclease McrA
MPDKRTYSTRAEYLKRAVALRRKAIKLKALKYKGKKCIFCQYDRYEGALEFHHKNSITKEFGIGQKGYTRAWDKVKKELDKCILVCSNCHKEVHAGLRSILE